MGIGVSSAMISIKCACEVAVRSEVPCQIIVRSRSQLRTELKICPARFQDESLSILPQWGTGASACCCRSAAAGGAAGELEDHLGQERLRAPAGLRRLPDPDQRRAQELLRADHGQGAGQGGSDAGRGQRGRTPVVREVAPGGGRPAMRVLHARSGPAHQVAHRSRPPVVARRDRQGPERAPVPLHRLREDHRRGRIDLQGQARRAIAAIDRQRRRRPVAGPLSRTRAGAGRPSRSSPTSRFPACCTARWCFRPMPVPACSASIPARPLRCRAW